MNKLNYSSPYVWGVIILAVIALAAVYFVHRARTLNTVVTREPAPPDQRLAQALQDMRAKGIATPEELSAETEVSKELAAPPPNIPGFPQTPGEIGEDRKSSARSGRAVQGRSGPRKRSRRAHGERRGGE